jgi:phytoene dehydrogenase-like protein
MVSEGNASISPGRTALIPLFLRKLPMGLKMTVYNFGPTMAPQGKTVVKVKVTIPNTLPGLKDFYMAGQWVRVGGGIPTCLSMGREAVRLICRRDRVKFSGEVPTALIPWPVRQAEQAR